ncbi:hypothetical protein FRC12_006581 [Ceratobasidium sp. 428]|nr:hypothetical protein FRC12_006581 [Ceratobasidium sp. 428]
MSTSTAHSRVFETPELLRAICGVSGRRVCTTLLRVNKSSFRVAVPFVWNNITHVINLLKLIPGVNSPAFRALIEEIGLPPFAGADFSRWIVYAPFVRSLVIEANVSAFPWGTLVMRSKQQHLLPHLSSLTIQQDHYEDHVTRELMWLNVFLTPSLTSICVQNPDIYIGDVSIWGISALLNMISTSCPRIQSIRLPEVSEETEEADGEHCLLNLLYRPVTESFLELSNLAALTASLWILRDGSLEALGSLPHLKHLRLFSKGANLDLLDLPETISSSKVLFPALEDLYLENLYFNQAKLVLDHRFLVKNLVSLALILNYRRNTADDIHSMLLMLKDMNNLNKLHVRFTAYYGGHNGVRPDGITLEVLSQLPLRTVQLDNMLFFNLSESKLGQIFPFVTELQIPLQAVDMHQFRYFAAIPNLQYLAVAFKDSATISQVASEETIVCPSLNHLELTNQDSDSFDFEPIHVKPIARYLLRLFPNIRAISWRAGFEENSIEYQCLALLNAHIEMSWEPKNVRASITG